MKGKYGGLAIKEYRIETDRVRQKHRHIVGNIPSFRNEILILVVGMYIMTPNESSDG